MSHCCRPDNGRVVQKGTAYLDNRWVVPYNPLLTQVFDCHINVEVCTGLHAVKYIYKYVHKGHDRAIAEIGPAGNEPINEMKTFVEGRSVHLFASLTGWHTYTTDAIKPMHLHLQYESLGNAAAWHVTLTVVSCRWVSVSEAVWRLMAFPMHSGSPPVTRLPFHLENDQNVCYADRMGESLQTVLERAEDKDTKFMGWLRSVAPLMANPHIRLASKNILSVLTRPADNQETQNAKALLCRYNALHPYGGNKALLYHEFPQGYVWDSEDNVWGARHAGTPATGRMYMTGPSENPLLEPTFLCPSIVAH